MCGCLSCAPYRGPGLQHRHVTLLQSRGGGGWFLHDKLLQKGFRLSVSGGSFPHAHLLGSQCPPPEERRLSMPEKVIIYLKSYTDLE